MIQEQSESNSEQGKDRNCYLSEEAGLTLLLGKIHSFEDCDWLSVQEGNKRALLRVGFIISLHFEITGVIYPVLPYSLSLSLSHTRAHTHTHTHYILYFLFTMLSYLMYFIGNEQRHNKAAFTLAATFVAACRQGLAMRSLAGVLTTGCLDSKLGFLPLHTNILEAKY